MKRRAFFAALFCPLLFPWYRRDHKPKLAKSDGSIQLNFPDSPTPGQYWVIETPQGEVKASFFRET